MKPACRMLVGCTFSTWRRGILGSGHQLQRSSAIFAGPRRCLAGERQLDENEDAERYTVVTLSTTRQRVWTSEEEGIIDRAILAGLSWRQCAPLLPTRRTEFAVKRRYCSRRRILRLQSGPQDETSEHIRLITKFVASGMTKNEIRMALPHLSVDNIKSMAAYHGLNIKRAPQAKQAMAPRWSAREDNIMKQEVRKGAPNIISLLKLLPRRTLMAIEKRAYYHRQARFRSATLPGQKRRWTAEEEETVKSKYTDGVPIAKIAEALSRTYKAIEHKLAGLRKQRLTPNRWISGSKL